MAKLSFYYVLLYSGEELALSGYDKKDVVFELWKLGYCSRDVQFIRKIKE